jgi:hypothetical protein
VTEEIKAGDWVVSKMEFFKTIKELREQNEKLQAQVVEMVAVAVSVRDDLLLRSEIDSDGRQHIDDIAVDRFAEAMKQKLAKQRQKGYGGWNDKELCPDGRLQKYLGAHLGKGDPVDIGNFAMMIWNRGESVTDAGVPDADYIRALQDALDIIQADANTEENYDSLRRIGSVLANIKAKQEQGQ